MVDRSMWNEEACTLTVEGEDVLEDVVLDVGYPAAGDGVVGVEERAAAERRLELGIVADELQPHPLGVVEESRACGGPRPSAGARTRASAAVLARVLATVAARPRYRGGCSLVRMRVPVRGGDGSPAHPKRPPLTRTPAASARSSACVAVAAARLRARPRR